MTRAELFKTTYIDLLKTNGYTVEYRNGGRYVIGGWKNGVVEYIPKSNMIRLRNNKGNRTKGIAWIKNNLLPNTK